MLKFCSISNVLTRPIQGVFQNRRCCLVKMSAAVFCSATIAVLSAPVSADVLGAKVGIDYFYSDLDVNGVSLSEQADNYRAYAAFEHFVPLLPNALLEYSTHGTDGAGFEQLSATGYYELLDNGLVALDVGAGVSRYSNITLVNDTSSETTPYAYIASEVMLPISHFSLFADAKLFGLRDVEGEDVALGLRWSTAMPIDVGLRLGYSWSDITFDQATGGRDADIASEGWLMGVDVRF